jgi:hypothetical protein
MHVQPLLQRRWIVGGALCVVVAPNYAGAKEEETPCYREPVPGHDPSTRSEANESVAGDWK